MTARKNIVITEEAHKLLTQIAEKRSKEVGRPVYTMYVASDYIIAAAQAELEKDKKPIGK
jgi:hypothetical protein